MVTNLTLSMEERDLRAQLVISVGFAHSRGESIERFYIQSYGIFTHENRKTRNKQ